MAKKPNIRTAGVDLGFLIGAHIAGWLNVPAWGFCVLVFVAIGVWYFTRRRALGRMSPRTRLTQSAIALVMLAGVMAFFYWMGLVFGGRT